MDKELIYIYVNVRILHLLVAGPWWCSWGGRCRTSLDLCVALYFPTDFPFKVIAASLQESLFLSSEKKLQEVQCGYIR